MPIDPNDLDALKSIVQEHEPAKDFEHLVAALIGELIGTGVAVAKSGFQHGGDAGTTGRQQRFLRIECKRYRDTTSLNERELLGEMDHAFARDPALEVWILAATREVSEQLEKALSSKGEAQGVPVLVLDWKSHETPTLAVLMASNPVLLESFLGQRASRIAARMLPEASHLIDRLKLDLTAWKIGTSALRRLAWTRINEIWEEPRQSLAHFGQNVSGGAKPIVHRTHLLQKLDDWWSAPPGTGSPACINGLFGVGKTWAVTDWLMQRSDSLPGVLLVPASALPGVSLGSAYAVKTFLAQRLQELTHVRDVEHWRNRLERILLRPESEGCALLLVLDGMSQQPGVQWMDLFTVMQADEFRGRIRVIATTRTHHFESYLSRLRGLVDQAIEIKVDVYDSEQGGEFDQMLKLHGLTRADVHPDLHNLARNPRLFDLVIRFRSRLVDGGTVTLHKLLWEYGRDTAGESMSRALSGPEWEEWLQAAAEKLRDGVRTYTTKELSEFAGRPYLDDRAIYQRLSDIIDTPFVKARLDRTLELTPEFVAHALGATAVSLLASAESNDRDLLESVLAQWLDPIAGLDQRADILLAAVAIALESGPPRPLLGVLTAAWLQTQNLAHTHIREAHLLAPEMPEALLDTIELSNRHTHVASQYSAVSALREVDRDNVRVRHQILARSVDWLRVVSRDVETRTQTQSDVEEQRHQRITRRLGSDVSGPRVILGESMLLVDRDDTRLAEHVPALLEGYPLSEAIPAFRVAAVAASVAYNHAGWNQLRWVFLLNPLDPDDATAAIRRSAEEFAGRLPEPGVHANLGSRVAQLLLHLPGQRADDEAAAKLDGSMGPVLSYEEHYLSNPTRSMYSLERRHACATLSDTSLRVDSRAQRCGDMWMDPSFEASPEFCREIAADADAVDVGQLYDGRYQTAYDNRFEKMQTAYARCAPRQLAALRRRLASSAVEPQSRAPRSWRINHALLLYGVDERQASRKARNISRENHEGSEVHTASELLVSELAGQNALTQALAVVEADMTHIPTSVTNILSALSTAQVDQLIERYQGGTIKQKRDVMVLLVTNPPMISDFAWAWLSGYTLSEDEVDRRLAYMALSTADPTRLGSELDGLGWRFTIGMDTFLAHAASGALLEATSGQPFDQVASRLAPWRLLETARYRGGDASEVRIAAEHLDAILTKGPLAPLDIGVNVTVQHDGESTSPTWYFVEPKVGADPRDIKVQHDAFSAEAQAAEQERTHGLAEENIRKARREGASLYLEFVSRDDALSLCRHAPGSVQRWIDGHVLLNPDFIRRVQQAEGLFLAICEGLLECQPEQGVSLWNSLQSALSTRILGRAKIPALLHILFRAPDSSAVLKRRGELLDLDFAKTDEDLYEIALVAALNGQGDWLDEQIRLDSLSETPWRRQRSATISGFRTGNILPIEGAWPEGPSSSWEEDVARRAARMRYLEACARHWWNEFWRIDDLDMAYAAWVLFCECADRRAFVWMEPDAARSPNSPELQAAKRRHWQANDLDLKRGVDKAGLSLGLNFLGRRTEDMVWPWRAH